MAVSGSDIGHGIEATTTLDRLRPGESATVVRCRGVEGPTGQRLLQLGLLRGRRVEMLRRAPTGDPLEVRILGSRLSLRASEARLVEVERTS